MYTCILRTLTRHRRTSIFFLRLGSSGEMQGALQFFAFGLLSPIFFGRLCDPGAALGCDQAPKTMILNTLWFHLGHPGSHFGDPGVHRGTQ